MPRFTLTRDGARATITFDDGGMNLLSSEALRELGETIHSLGSLTDSGLLIFCSSRSKLFAAGADMNEMRRFAACDAEEFARLGQSLFAMIESLHWISAAIIDGDCFGGALDLAMSFDLRFASPGSRFSHPGARLGIATGFGGTSRWRRLLDRAAARRLFLGNGVLSADEALAAGLVDRVAGSFDDELSRLDGLDHAFTRFLKELAPRSERLGARELKLLAERLGALYGVGSLPLSPPEPSPPKAKTEIRGEGPEGG